MKQLSTKALLKGGYLLLLLSKYPSDLWNKKLGPEKDAWVRPPGSIEDEIGHSKPALSLSVSVRVVRAIAQLAPDNIGDELASIKSDLERHGNRSGAYGNFRGFGAQGETLVNASSRHTAAALMIYFELLKLGRSVIETDSANKTVRWLLRNQEHEQGFSFGGWALEVDGEPDWYSTASVIEALHFACGAKQLRDAADIKTLRNAINGGLGFFLRDYKRTLRRWGTCEAAVYLAERRSIMDSCDALMKILALLDEEWIESKHKAGLNKARDGLVNCQKPNGDVGNEPRMSLENTIMLCAMLAVCPKTPSTETRISQCSQRFDILIGAKKGTLGLHMNELALLLMATCQTKAVTLTESEIVEIRHFAKSADRPIRLLRAIPREVLDLYGQNYAYVLSDGRTHRPSAINMFVATLSATADRFLGKKLKWVTFVSAVLTILTAILRFFGLL